MPLVISAPSSTSSTPRDIRTPDWVTYRGVDVRAYDRQSEREVYGPGHPFSETYQLLITNGLVSFWLGNRGLSPYLNVQAANAGAWWQSGVLSLLPLDSPGLLLSARLIRVTPQVATVGLKIRGWGEVFVSLRKGRRFLEIEGSDLAPEWLGAPPTFELADESDDGKFGLGHAQRVTVSRFRWPTDVDKAAWSLAYWWLPDAADDTSGLGSIFDTSGARAVHTRYDETDNKIKFTIGAATCASSALTLTPGDPVFVATRLSPTTGMALTVRQAGVTQHVTNAAVDPGTSLDYESFAFLTTGSGTWGGGTWGSGTWGGWIGANGVIDNLMVLADRLTDDEAAGLAAATVPLAGIAGIEGLLAYYAPFDIVPYPAFTTASGRTVETTAGADGLKRVVARLTDSSALAGFVGSDSAADMQAQFDSASKDEVRVR